MVVQMKMNVIAAMRLTKNGASGGAHVPRTLHTTKNFTPSAWFALSQPLLNRRKSTTYRVTIPENVLVVTRYVLPLTRF